MRTTGSQTRQPALVFKTQRLAFSCKTRWFLCHTRLLALIAILLPVCLSAASRESGLLTVAVYKDFAPFSRDGATEYRGVDVALANRLAQRLNLKCRILPFDAGESMSDDLRNMVWRGDVMHYGPADVMMHVPVDRRFTTANEQALIFAPYYR